MTHPRSSWQSPAKPVTGPPIDWRRIDTVVIHYTAAPNCPEGDDRPAYAAYLRSMQASYLSSRGYSLGYSVAVATVGESWAIRWTDIRPAATKGWNDRTFAILVTVDGDRPASPAAVAEVQALIAMATTLAGRPLAIKGHGELGATACPGTGLRAQITAGVFTPTPPPPTPTGDDMPFMWRDSRWANVFLVGSCPAQNISGASMAMLTAKGVPLVVDQHDQFLATCLHQSGLTAADLVPA